MPRARPRRLVAASVSLPLLAEDPVPHSRPIIGRKRSPALLASEEALLAEYEVLDRVGIEKVSILDGGSPGRQPAGLAEVAKNFPIA